MLAVASLKRSLEFDPVEQGVKRKRAEMKLSPPSSPIPSTTTYIANASPAPSPSKQQQSLFTSSPNKSQSLIVKKPCALTALTTASPSSATDDIPMFTFAQAAQMCTRLLREQDQSLREQYEQILSYKLTEQYDTFVRYTHDSVYKTRTKEQHHRLFHFGQSQDTNNSSSVAFSYVS